MKCIGHFKTSWEAFITVASLVQFTPYCPYFQCCIFFQKKNKEKHLEISLFYACLPKILMIWSKVLKIYIERVWQNEIGDYGSFFALPPTHPPKKILDTIILHMSTKNHNCMRYCSWDMRWDRLNFLSLWAIF